MNKDEIIRMAREAGVVIDGNNSGEDSLLYFAALVVAAEREACAQLARKIGDATEPDDWALDVCQDIESAIRERYGDSEGNVIARTAIAKAEGGAA